ncbi:MAG: hypothetical protein M3139_03705, partial [Bacteroidota bacterium]|nr:hypothetical protein [Bacteroidota bacterium]
IDSEKPVRPALLFDSSKVSIYDNSVDLYIRQDSVDNLVNRYVIYNFQDTSSMDKSLPQNIVEIIQAGSNYYKFNLQNIPAQQNTIVIAATSLSKTNNESDLSRYIYLERKSNGWHVISAADNN